MGRQVGYAIEKSKKDNDSPGQYRNKDQPTLQRRPDVYPLQHCAKEECPNSEQLKSQKARKRVCVARGRQPSSIHPSDPWRRLNTADSRAKKCVPLDQRKHQHNQDLALLH